MLRASSPLHTMAIAFVFVSLFSLLIPPQTATASSTLNTLEVEQFMDRVIPEHMEQYRITGATVALVADGQVLLSKGYGYANREEQQLVDPETTLFRIGSLSKLITWTAVMQLVEQGEIDLDTDVNTYLDFVIPAELARPLHTVDAAPITLRHLLTHTPGFEDISSGLFYLNPNLTLELGDYVREFLPARVFPAGDVVAYSNYGAALAGYIVERASGLPFSDYVENNVFEPLGMTPSTFDQPPREDMPPEMAIGYNQVDGQYRAGRFIYVNPEPAGSMSSTASDMAIFMMTHLQGGMFDGAQILQPETLHEMHRHQFAQDPRHDGITLGFIEGTINGRRVLFHGGNLPLFNSGLYLLPQENVGLFVSYSGGMEVLAHAELWQAFMDEHYPSVHTIPGDPESSGAGRLDLAGEYHPNRRSFSTDERLLALLQSMRVDVDNEGNLRVGYMGETHQFSEQKDGIYARVTPGPSPNPFGAFQHIAFQTDPFGRVLLATDGVMSYSRAPWYGSMPFTALALIITLPIVLGSLAYWSISTVRQMVRDRKAPLPTLGNLRQLTAIGFAVIVLGIVLRLIRMSEMSPVYGVPLSFFAGVQDDTLVHPVIPLLLAATLVGFTAATWWKRDGQMSGRIHYSVFTAAALTLLFILRYWHIV